MKPQKPVLSIGTSVEHNEATITVVEIKRDTVVFDNGLEVSHAEIEFAYDAARS